MSTNTSKPATKAEKVEKPKKTDKPRFLITFEATYRIFEQQEDGSYNPKVLDQQTVFGGNGAETLDGATKKAKKKLTQLQK